MKAIQFLSATLASIFFLTSCKETTPTFQSPLLKNIGDYNVTVTTNSSYAQQFFNQGVIMANGFNHGEAERSFKEAVRLDSTFAMGYWGIAYVMGPNLNSADNLGAVKEINEAVANAVKFSSSTTDWEKALIKSIQVKFPSDTISIDSDGYMESLKEAYNQFPDNTFVATLFAESIMNIHAWDFFAGKGGEARPWTPEIISLLDKVIAMDPKNPLANHLYLHATEAGSDFTNALKSAEQLKTLVPGAGHLVHMPSHIYINTGDYHAGTIANEAAVEADSIYIAECSIQGYYPQMYYTHNYHFLAATAAFEGRAARSIEAAYKTAAIVDLQYANDKAFETVQHYITIPNHVLVKFGQWEKIQVLPQPREDLKYPTAIWHYAKGMAFANTNKLTEARESLAQLNTLTGDPAIAEQMIWGINYVSEVCKIASKVLEATIYEQEGNYDKAITLLSEAIKIEDTLNYTEPPDWFFSVRHVLGNILLKAKQYEQAEKIYAEDLQHWPKNGFALSGLRESLMAQGKTKEAQEIESQFAAAWQYADVELKGSMIDPDKRINIALRIDETSPNMLVYLNSALCFAR